MEDTLIEDTQRDWNLLAKNGEMATLIESVSEGKVSVY
jgi:hypothetical protein